MIARRWHGLVPAAKAEEYLRLMKDVGLPDYRSTAGNRGAWCLHRRDGEVVHVEMFTLWDDLEAIGRFAGDDVLKAKYYDFDPIFSSSSNPKSLTSRCFPDRHCEERQRRSNRGGALDCFATLAMT